MPLLEEAAPRLVETGAPPRSARTTSVVLCTTSAELAELAPQWNQLAGEIPFRRHEWLAAWWQHFAASRAELRVVEFRDPDGTLHGLMPWYLDRSLWQGRVLRLLGSGIVCTDYVSLLADPPCQAPLAGRLAEWLDGPGSREWDAIELAYVDPGDPAFSTLVTTLREAGHVVHEQGEMSRWCVALPPTFEEYLSRFSKRRRDRILKASKQWFDSGRAQIKRVRQSDELAQGWGIFTDLHQRRRQSLGQPGCFASPRFGDFLYDASARMLAADRLRLSWLECEGRPAAIELDFTGGTSLFCYQMGMDPDLATYEPGNLRMAGTVRWAIEAGYERFDLLRGDEPYKAIWQAEPQPLTSWRVVNRHLTSRCRHRIWLGAQAGKRWAKRVRDRRKASHAGKSPAKPAPPTEK